MGLFVSRLLSNDMRTLELMIGELARAIREGEWESLMTNADFWTIVGEVASNPATLQELRGYVSGLLEEDWRTSSLLLDMLSPGLSATQRRFVISFLKLELISRCLRSEVFWKMAMRREIVTAIWKLADKGWCSNHEWSVLTSTHEGTEAFVRSAPPVSTSPQPPLARFFTILTLPPVLTLLQDISKTPPSLPIVSAQEQISSNSPKDGKRSKRGKSSTANLNDQISQLTALAQAQAQAQSQASANSALPQLSPFLTPDSKTNFILLCHRDLLKLDQIFDRERSAVAPVPGAGDINYTGLGFERKTYIVIRGIIKFLLYGSKLPSKDSISSPSPSSLSVVARIFLDQQFQSTFLTRDFLSHVFQQKLNYFISLFPADMAIETAYWSATSVHDLESDASAASFDAQLCHSLRAYGAFFVELLADSHVMLLFRFLQQYDDLFIDKLVEILYLDITLPLLRPAQYVRSLVFDNAVSATRHSSRENSTSSNGGNSNQPLQAQYHFPSRLQSADGSDTSKSAISDPKSIAAGTSKPIANAAVFPLPPLSPPPSLSSPFVVHSSFLVGLAFCYHWLFEPVPMDIIEDSRAHLRAARRANAKGDASVPTHLRSIVLHLTLFQEWAKIIATPPMTSPAQTRVHPSAVPSFSRTLHSLVNHAASLRILDYLQTYAPHIAYCLSKALDEVNLLLNTNKNPSDDLFAYNGSMKRSQAVSAASPVVDMFAPHLSFTGSSNTNGSQTSIDRTPAPSVSAPVLSAPSASTSAIAGAVTNSDTKTSKSTKPASNGYFSSVTSWWYGGRSEAESKKPVSATTPVPPATSSAPSSQPSPLSSAVTKVPTSAVVVPSSFDSTSTTALISSLPADLVCSRSRFDVYIHHQLRLWCSRVLEGRGFMRFADQQRKIGFVLPSTIFIAANEKENLHSLFPPLASIPSGNSEVDVFYVELMAFDPLVVERFLRFAYIYQFVDSRDELKRLNKEKTIGLLQQQLEKKQTVKPPSYVCSPLFPLVSKNMSSPHSTPIDLGPIRTREYFSLLSRELVTLLQETHISNFLNRSENFWRFLIDTRWWDIVQQARREESLSDDASKEKAKQLTIGGPHQLLAHPRAPKVSQSTQTTLHAFLTLISDKSSPYFLLLIELGHHQLFDDFFSDTNISHVLSLMRLVCSWQVHEKLKQYEEARVQPQQPGGDTNDSNSTLNAIASQDYYSTLTAPFTLWGVVHSLSVVTPLREQYKGAVRWFLSKRNMEMQVEIWKVVKEVLYGDEDTTDSEGQNPQGTTAVPAPTPLHMLSSNTTLHSPYLRQKLRVRRLQSLARICNSVHGSGIIQAVFTFPLATAHFYAVNVAEMLWKHEQKNMEDAVRIEASRNQSAHSTSNPTDSSEDEESSTSLLINQLLSLLYILARTSEQQSYLHIPAVRGALLEWINVALEEMDAYGSGVTLAAQERSRQKKEEELAAKRREHELFKREVELRKEQEQREEAKRQEAAEAKRNKRSNKKKNGKVANTAAESRQKVASAAHSTDMFDASSLYRETSASTPSASSPSSISTPNAVSSSRFVPVVDDVALSPATARAQAEVGRLFPFSNVVASQERVTAILAPDNIPKRFHADNEAEADKATPVTDNDSNLSAAQAAAHAALATPAPVDASSANQPGIIVASSPSESASGQNPASVPRVSLPPPFAFESSVDMDDEERSSQTTPAGAAATAAVNNPRTAALHTDAALHEADVVQQQRTGSRPAAAKESTMPSLPQKHRLLYAFFQLLISEPIFKLILTSASLWEMLSDVSFLELATSLLFGSIETDEKKQKSKEEFERNWNGGSGTSTSASTLLKAAKHQLSQTTHALSAKYAKVKLLQRLFAHYRFQLLMEELKNKHYEVHMASCMQHLLDFLNSDKGEALLASVMHALEQSEQESNSNITPTAAPRKSFGLGRGRLPTTISARLSNLRTLLSHPSTVRLLTSPKFWLLFTDSTTISYFSNGQYLRLWLHQQRNIRQIPLWQLLKKGGSKVTNTVRNAAAKNKTADAERDATGTSSSGHTSKREQLRGFLKKTIQSASAKQGVPINSSQSSQAASSVENAQNSTQTNAQESQASMPKGIAAIQHFVSIVQAVHDLFTGNVAHEQNRVTPANPKSIRTIYGNRPRGNVHIFFEWPSPNEASDESKLCWYLVAAEVQQLTGVITRATSTDVDEDKAVLAGDGFDSEGMSFLSFSSRSFSSVNAFCTVAGGLRVS